MKITGVYTLRAPSECVWPIIFDPVQLMGLIPGCEQMEADGPDLYHGAITLRLPAITGTYRTSIAILEQREPEYCRMQGEAAGPGGGVKGQAAFTLSEADGGTLVQYDGDALISGPLAGMNSRFVEGVAQQLIKQGLARLDAQAVAAMSAESAAVEAGAARHPPGPWARFKRWLQRMFKRE
jgi:hypothetical protein